MQSEFPIHKMSNKSYFIIFSSVFFIVFLIIGFFVINSWYHKRYLPRQIENPQAFWEENIKSLLLQYGKEHKLEDVDTSQWETYRNEKYGFEFKIPPGHYVNEDNKDYKNSPYYFSMIMPIDKNSNGCYISINSSEYEGYYYLLEQQERYKKYIDKESYYLLDYAYTDLNKLFSLYVYDDYVSNGSFTLENNWVAWFYSFNNKYIKLKSSSECEAALSSGIMKSFKYTN